MEWRAVGRGEVADIIEGEYESYRGEEIYK